MGMQPYGMVPPTGYPTRAESWQSSGGLLARINYVTLLSQGQLPGVPFDPATLITLRLLENPNVAPRKDSPDSRPPGLASTIGLIENAILLEDLPAKDESVIEAQMKDPDVQRQMSDAPLDALRLATQFILGSPEFQRH
jgi:hypothetical protein